MTELIYINDKFKPEALKFLKENNIVFPELNKIYSIRYINRNFQGKYEVLLNEIVNKEVPIKHHILGLIYREPTWNLNRFAKLDGSSLTKEEIDELIKAKEEDFVKVKKK